MYHWERTREFPKGHPGTEGWNSQSKRRFRCAESYPPNEQRGAVVKKKRHTLLNIGVEQTELTTDIDISFSYYFFPLLNQTHLNSHFLWGGGGGGLVKELGSRDL